MVNLAESNAKTGWVLDIDSQDWSIICTKTPILTRVKMPQNANSLNSEWRICKQSQEHVQNRTKVSRSDLEKRWSNKSLLLLPDRFTDINWSQAKLCVQRNFPWATHYWHHVPQNDLYKKSMITDKLSFLFLFCRLSPVVKIILILYVTKTFASRPKTSFGYAKMHSSLPGVLKQKFKPLHIFLCNR